MDIRMFLRISRMFSLSILSAYKNFKTAQHIAHINRIRNENPEIGNLSDEAVSRIYNSVVSCFQSKGGKFLERHIEDLLKTNGLQFKSQVHIDVNGIVVSGGGKTIIDIVFGNPVVGTHISDYIVMSLKTTSRERVKLDTAWTYKHPPKLFLYATLEADYPQPSTFGESPTRRLVCATPRKKDTRAFKMGFEDILQTIHEFE
jgi:hypothetical protein